MATVTVVEDFDPASLIYGPSDPVVANEEPAVDKSGRRILPSSRQTAQAPVKQQHTSKPLLTGVRAKEKKKPKDIKYLTIADRKVAKRKQFARHTEKAERAGGKQSRKPSSGRRRLERK
jgi:ribosomal RNA-processing protein 17